MYQTLLKPFFLDIKKFFSDTLFPISCLGCGEEGSFICAICKASLIKLEHQRCIVCQKPTPFGITHPRCQTSYGADGLLSFFDYRDKKMSAILIAGKYNFIPATFEVLGGMISEKMKKDYAELLKPNPPSGGSNSQPVLVPIPLASSRRRWRGFNQAEVLCQKLSNELGLQTANFLVRHKPTKTQKDLKKEQRIKNVAGSFSLARESDIRGLNIILVDDVITTGSTLREAVQVLKRNDAKSVWCLTASRD